uniref:ubiquitinyl hydrolase 1 n=1 Tax=Marseillevirus LCMAC201 TaxID=2506605 RepID=A0A481YWU1_9VIRU|nr:MAG: OTU-like cysteine protease [Marseillevirus LCMAC201]
MSCLFNSLAPAVNLHPEVLRKAIAAYLKTDPELLDNVKATDVVEWTEGSTLEEYADRMSQSGTWGGAIEIKAFCELFDMDVTVHVIYTGKEFTVESSKTPLRIVHINYTGNHFESMYIELV